MATALALAIAGLGAAPALAEEEATYDPAEAQLTKVIVAPEDTDVSGDTFTFHFEGDGTVTESGDDLVVGSIVQDATIKKGDEIPAIPDCTLSGTGPLNEDNSLTNGQSFQTVVQKPLSEILGGVVFPHAGVYTYKVTESATSTALAEDGYYINPSKAAYILRVRVVNAGNGTTSTSVTKVEAVTLERTLDDDGRETDAGKVDPTYPQATNGKITHVKSNTVPGDNTLAGENSDRGRDVYGFTFANEYVLGGEFKVTKLVEGDYADKTKYFDIELQVHDAASTAEDAQGCVVTYLIEGEGIDNTDNLDADGAHRTLNGVTGIAQSSHSIAVFDAETGIATIDASLKEGSTIRITGVFGPYASDYTGPSGEKRMILSTSGLLAGEAFKVLERTPGDYDPTGYVYVGEDPVDPRTDASGMTATPKKEDGSLELEGEVPGSATTVFVVNKLEDDKVSPTGIFIDNLPYILMVGVPLVVFAGLLVARRRGSATA